jgi:hypothetical protein
MLAIRRCVYQHGLLLRAGFATVVEQDDQPSVAVAIIVSLALLFFVGLLTWLLVWLFGQLSF